MSLREGRVEAPAKRRYSLAHLTVIELAPPEAVSCAAAAGFDLLDLRLQPVVPTDVLYPVFGDTQMRRDLMRRLDDTGMRIFDVELLRLTRNSDRGEHIRLFEVAAHIGASHVKLACAEEDEHVAADLVARAAEQAADFEIHVDLEFMPFSGIKTVEAAVRVVTASGAGNAGVLIDALHLHRSGGKIAAIRDIPPALLSYVHLCDAPIEMPPDLDAIMMEARVARLIPGDGGLHLAELMSALPRDAVVSLELPMKEMAARVPAIERARLALAGAQRIVARAEMMPHAFDLRSS